MVTRINKFGSLHLNQMIAILLGVIILLTMFNFTYVYLNDNYDSEVFTCNFFMSNVDGKTKYFGDSLNDITLLFKDSVSVACPSKEVELYETNLVDSAKLVKSCYDEIGSGEDFFGANVEGKSVCIHCGFIKVKDDISNFNEKFSKILTGDKYTSLFDEDDELLNTNNLFLSEKSLMGSVTEGEYLRVLAYGYKPEVTGIGNFFSTQFSKLSGEYLSSVMTYLLSDSLTKGFSGVIIDRFDGYEKFSSDREVGFNQGDSSVGCDVVIIPKKNYK